jgi:OMF family outer membrane factor
MGPVSTITIPMPTGDQTIEVGTGETWSYGVSAYQSLYSAGRNAALRALARLGLSTAELDAALQRRQIALLATEAFYRVSESQGLREVAGQDEQRATEQLQVAIARVDAGAAPRFDQLRAEVEVANAHQVAISAETAVESAKNQLKNLLAIDMAQPIQIALAPEIVRIVPDRHACRQLARDTREEIGIARAQAQIAEQNVRLARSERGVNVGAIGAYQRQSSSGFGATDYSWSVGVQASKPILDGGSSRSRQQQAEEQVAQAEILTEQMTELVALDVALAALAVQEADARLASTAQTVTQAQEAVRLAGVRYEAGVGTAVEVTDARTALTAAETNQVNAASSYQIAIARLARAVGAAVDEIPTVEQ